MPNSTDLDFRSTAATVPQPEIQDVLPSILSYFESVSDIFFSPGCPPQVERGGQLLPVPGFAPLSAEDTARIASSLMGENAKAEERLRSEGACEISYSVPSVSRFRVNIFAQRGSYAVVVRAIPHAVPNLESLKMPPQLGEIADLQSGLVLVTGPTGSGKSSTLAALIDNINQERACHIITIEDPIEFIHSHKKSIVHQRELYSDAPSYSQALRAALRQAPKVILIGELRDPETIEIALEAAEAGHLVLSAMRNLGASTTVERTVRAFPPEAQPLVRNRLARTFRYIVCQRLLPSTNGATRVPLVEILKSTPRTREYVEKGEKEGKSLLDAMRDGQGEGMQDFDTEIEKLIRGGQVDLQTGLAYATNVGNLKLKLSDLRLQAAFGSQA